MITNENGLKYAYLIFVSQDNHNKYYEMQESNDGYIDILYGRVDSTKIVAPRKPINQWNSIYNSKVKKGYTDVTNLRAVETVSTTDTKVSKYKDISDPKILTLIKDLQNYAGESVKKNYKVESSKVTQKMIDEAQNILNTISPLIKINNDYNTINKYLIELFKVIPRKMSKVQYYLLDKELKDNNSLDIAKKRISEEQDILDSLAGKVLQNITADPTLQSKLTPDNITILDQMGIIIEPATIDEYNIVKRYMIDQNGIINRGKELFELYRVNNINTQKAFDYYINSVKNKKIKLMFHGSRNQNWIYILPKGLLIRPSGAIITGAMLGNAIYGAEASEKTDLGNICRGYAKSFGYTSGKGSHWANGSDIYSYMAIMEFHVGEQMHLYTHDSSCYNLHDKFAQSNFKYDSIYMHGTNDGGKYGGLINSEFTIYKPQQCTIKYLMKLKA